MLALEDREAGGSACAEGKVVRLAKGRCVRFSELVRLLEANGFRLVKEKGSIRYDGKPGWDRLIRVD